MKMSIDTYNQLSELVDALSLKINIPDFRKRMLDSGNSETRFAFDVFYMINPPSDLLKKIWNEENLNDSHIETAMKKILKKY